MKKTIYDVAVVGAGASGLTAAIAAARFGASVVLLEHKEQAAKKLLSTGNGKCNYTNTDQALEHYYCDDPEFLKKLFGQFSYLDTIHFFEQLGIRPVKKNGTCIYPESEQAASVKSVLLAEIKRLCVPLLLSVGIRSIHKMKTVTINGMMQHAIFAIETKTDVIYSRTCILAAGGKAAKKTGSDGSGYVYASQLGHTVRTPLPALTALLTDDTDLRLSAGVRIACTAALYVDGIQKDCESGELQITDYGISGIVVFQFSRIASIALAKNRQVHVCLDFKPSMSEEQLAEYLKQRFDSVFHKEQAIEEALIGFLPDKLIFALLQQAKIRPKQICEKIDAKQVRCLARQMKYDKVNIIGTKSFDAAQVTAGGVLIQEINPKRMASNITKGLYFAGEIMDVDAKCGGYNLQWAWSSGYVAGKNAASAAGQLRQKGK